MDQAAVTEPPSAAPGRRWARVAAGVVAAPLLALGLLLVLTPTVDDAPARSAALAGPGPRLTTLPTRLTAAVLAVEDHRFYRHFGLDPLAVGRFAQGALRGRDEGGSTIDVQLAKLLYTGGRADWRSQAVQVALALKLDHRYGKNQLLLMYLNGVYFGPGYVGATAAAWGYFGVGPGDLDWPQAALLAGLLQAPTNDDPLRHPAAALARRNHALDRLAALGWLSAAAARGDRTVGLELAPR